VLVFTSSSFLVSNPSLAPLSCSCDTLSPPSPPLSHVNWSRHRYVTSVFTALLPPSLLGSPSNTAALVSHLVTFCTLRRHETLSLDSCMTNIRVNAVTWMPKHPGAASHLKRTLCVRRVVKYVLTVLLTPLLRSLFYVTETEFGGNKVFYYRKPVWSRFQNLSMSALQSDQYTYLTNGDVRKHLPGMEMGVAQLRLLPKKTGVRAIAMLSKRRFVEEEEAAASALSAPVASASAPSTTCKKKRKKTNFAHLAVVARMKSTNVVLNQSFQCLKYEHSQDPSLFGYGVYGTDGVFPKAVEFKEKCRRAAAQGTNGQETNGGDQGNLPPLYFASVDIHHCYDTINQSHLFTLLQSVLTEPQYAIKKYTVCHPYGSRQEIHAKHVKTVAIPGDIRTFGEVAEGLADEYTQSM